eukprot:1180652-Prorocentrum_minimum.AAC.3
MTEAAAAVAQALALFETVIALESLGVLGTAAKESMFKGLPPLETCCFLFDIMALLGPVGVVVEVAGVVVRAGRIPAVVAPVARLAARDDARLGALALPAPHALQHLLSSLFL